jgi:hypothetical protein
MKKHDLQTSVANYEGVLKSCWPLFESGNSLVRALCHVFVTKAASLVLQATNALDDLAGSAPHREVGAEGVFRLGRTLPDPELAHNAAQRLFEAVASRNLDEVRDALEDMGVLALCPSPDGQFERLELIVAPLLGRSHLVSLVEISMFAAEHPDHKRARQYATEARAFDPGASEQHDLYAVEGIVALSEKNPSKAIADLGKSMEACMADGYACLTCGTRAPNLALAERLLEQGRQAEVVDYLTRCQRVWERNRREIASWINSIEAGGRPNFFASGFLRVMNHPAVRIRYLLARAHSGDVEQETASDDPPADVIADRERLRAEYKNLMNAAVKGKMGSSNN